MCKKKFKQLSQLKNHSVIHMDKEKDVVSFHLSLSIIHEVGLNSKGVEGFDGSACIWGGLGANLG